MADTGVIADLSMWDEKRTVSILNYINEIRKERKAIREVKHDEKYFKKIFEDIDKHQISDEVKEFKKFAGEVRKTNNDLYLMIIDLMKFFMHTISMEIAIEHKLKEAGQTHNMPVEVVKGQLTDMQQAAEISVENLDTIRLAATKVAKTATK